MRVLISLKNKKMMKVLVKLRLLKELRKKLERRNPKVMLLEIGQRVLLSVKLMTLADKTPKMETRPISKISIV